MLKRFKKTDYFIENKLYSKELLEDDYISVLNWNIQKKNTSKLWVNEYKEIIEKYNPTINIFQECQFVKGLENLLHSECFGFVFAPNFIDIFNNKHSGVLTASHIRHSLVSVTQSHAHEPFIHVSKIFLSTTYKIKNYKDELLVLNIHAINFVGYWKFISQVQQIEFAIKIHNGPVVLSGDFNTWSKKRYGILNKIITDSGLLKVLFTEKSNKHIKKFLFLNTLDHIYYKGLKVENNSRVLKTKSSDHNPLLVNFKLDL